MKGVTMEMNCTGILLAAALATAVVGCTPEEPQPAPATAGKIEKKARLIEEVQPAPAPKAKAEPREDLAPVPVAQDEQKAKSVERVRKGRLTQEELAEKQAEIHERMEARRKLQDERLKRILERNAKEQN